MILKEQMAKTVVPEVEQLAGVGSGQHALGLELVAYPISLVQGEASEQ